MNLTPSKFIKSLYYNDDSVNCATVVSFNYLRKEILIADDGFHRNFG